MQLFDMVCYVVVCIIVVCVMAWCGTVWSSVRERGCGAMQLCAHLAALQCFIEHHTQPHFQMSSIGEREKM